MTKPEGSAVRIRHGAKGPFDKLNSLLALVGDGTAVFKKAGAIKAAENSP